MRKLLCLFVPLTMLLLFRPENYFTLPGIKSPCP